jgi:predicted negative regulator of RcsB-dependent stress response
LAKYKKKRARELQHDRFRDTTMRFFEGLGDRLEGRGYTILYGLGGLLVAAVLIFGFVKWSNRKSDEARQALGHGITISRAQIAAAPIAGNTELTFTSEKERAQRAIDVFEQVAAKYGEPYKASSRYFIATNKLILDRPKAMSELAELGNSGVAEVAPLAKFALAQAQEGDGKFQEAAQLYSDLAKLNGAIITAETANLRLAKVYEKLGKKKEASDLLFNIVDASRKAKAADKTLPTSSAAREAAEELKKLDPDRHAQLPPENISLAG